MRVIKCRVGQYAKLMAEVPGFVYCGRAFRDYPASPLGNPYVVGRDGTLAEVLALYRRWLFDRLELLNLVGSEHVLGCWCVNDYEPLSTPRDKEVCHCQVIAKAFNWALAHHLMADEA